ncbi:hypothetical protein JRC04_01795 [Mycolicibacterium sp. S2-37]|uniref:hypothetical protein n=1 Tax=Mycolicibacterium sp. S2-37 TaxID=2810297 RepID=UPI001A940BB8|nr:hypothetical protein [Mycolicibacterium sp. S2-37]MBO0676190.1 hypothetical protein [Mycolicibacterium sp. S2-37]
MIVIGLIVLGAALIVGTAGLLSNAGPTHQLTGTFSVLGYDVTGSTGMLFLLGIVVGALGVLGLGALLAGALRTAERGRDARRRLAQSRRETAFINRGCYNLRESDKPAGAIIPAGTMTEPDTAPRRGGILNRSANCRPASAAPIHQAR